MFEVRAIIPAIYVYALPQELDRIVGRPSDEVYVVERVAGVIRTFEYCWFIPEFWDAVQYRQRLAGITGVHATVRERMTEVAHG